MELDEVCTRIATAVVALDATDWQQADDVAEAWNESPVPLASPLYSPESTAHLAFTVMVPSSPNANGLRDTPGDLMRCASRIDVVFAYRLRGDLQVDDSRASMRAALQLVRCVNNESTWLSEDEVLVHVLDRYRPTFTFDGQYLVVTTSFVVTHDEEV